MSSETCNVRPSAIAGTWYPGHPTSLREMVQKFIGDAEIPDLPGEVVGLISPHAGYIYSGHVAGHAYRAVYGASFDLVVVVSPVHRMFVGPYAITSADAYETPLGIIPLDSEAVAAVEQALPVTRIPWDNEHALEIQLPFLQVALAKLFRLLPVMLGDQRWAACKALAEAIVPVVRGRSALLVASTDLSHFHSATRAEELDRVALDCIAEFNPLELARAIEQGRTEACGAGPVITVMLAAKALGANQAVVLKYAHSGHVTGDYHQVVGYGAAALLRVP